MRRTLLVALLTTLAAPAIAQVNDLPAPDASVQNAIHPGHAVPNDTNKTALQIEAERVEAYRRAYNLQNPAPAPTSEAGPAARRAPAIVQPAAPNGITNIDLYNTPASVGTHTVIKDDTLYSLSKRYGVTVQDLQRVNRISGTNIALGQTLIVPAQKRAAVAPQPAAPQAARRVQPSPDGRMEPQAADTGARIMRYAVAPGDTLAAIARRTCVERALLINENKLTNPDELFPGQMLALPDNHCLAR